MTASTSATNTICARSVRRIKRSPNRRPREGGDLVSALIEAWNVIFKRGPRVRGDDGLGVPPVTEAVDRVDGGERRVYRLELAPDALHVRGDGRVVDHDVRIAHQALAILDVARIARERVHEPELGQREIDRRLAPGRLEALHVEAQRAALE